MIDHLTLTVSSYALSRRFYQHALAALGRGLLYETDGAGGAFGVPGSDDFAIVEAVHHTR